MKKKNILFLDKLIEELSKQGMRVRFVDRRWEKRGDVDCVIHPKDYQTCGKLLEEKEFRFISKNNYSRYYRLFLHDEIIHFTIKKSGLVRACGKRFGSLFTPQTVARSKDEFVLSYADQLAFMLFKKGIGRPLWKFETYYDELVQEKIDGERLQFLLKKGFRNHRELLSLVKKKAPLSQVEPKLRFYMYHRFLANFWKKNLKRAYHVVFPRMYIAFVGPDGTGKTTTVNSVCERLNSSKIKAKTFYSGRYQIKYMPINLKKMPKNLKSFFDKQDYVTQPDVKKNKEIREFKSPWIKLAMPFFYYPEYLMRYLFTVKPARIDNVVLTDRGWLDIYCSPNSNKTLARIMYYFIPQPRYILLWNEPEVMHERNSKHPLSDQKRQLKMYKSIADKYWMVIKTDDVEAVTNAVVKKIEKEI